MARLEVKGLCKGWDFPVLDGLDLTVEEGEFFVVVGPSGIGKTTLLRLVAGLETADAGSIIVGGRDVTRIPPYKRNVAMTFESYALYPHMTVFKNIASPLVARKTDSAEIDKRVSEVASLLQIDQLLDRKPGEISGGQKQRCALGRTLVANPDVFLLDEPISHLDAKIRHELREQFHTLDALRKVATLYVTHDYSEALSLGDRIGVMGSGGLVQTGSPRELFEKPGDLFVARNLGQPTINIIETKIAGKKLESPGASFKLSAKQQNLLNGHKSGEISLGIRPQNVRILQGDEKPGRGHQAFKGSVDIFDALGAHSIIIVDIGGTMITALGSPDAMYEYGQEVTVAVETGSFHLFDTKTGKVL